MIELYSEDGSKRYFAGTSSDFQKHESDLMNAVFLCSTVGTVEANDCVEEFIIVGTSRGEIYQYGLTKNNSIIQNLDKKFIYRDGKHAITSIGFDEQSSTILAGTHSSHIIQL